MSNDTELKPPPEPDDPPPPPPPLSADRVEFRAGPYLVAFDKSEPAEPHPGHTGAPQMRLVEIRHVDAPLVRGMSGWLGSHEIQPGTFVWMGGAHGYERAGVWSFAQEDSEAMAIAQSWIGPTGAPIAEREVKYRVSVHNGVLGMHVTSTTRAYVAHRVRDVYDYMLPLVRLQFYDWRADTLPVEQIYQSPSGSVSVLTPSAVTIRAQGNSADNRPSLRYQGHRGAQVYARQLVGDDQCKLYHRSLWQEPVTILAGHEWRTTASIAIGYNC